MRIEMHTDRDMMRMETVIAVSVRVTEREMQDGFGRDMDGRTLASIMQQISRLPPEEVMSEFVHIVGLLHNPTARRDGRPEINVEQIIGAPVVPMAQRRVDLT